MSVLYISVCNDYACSVWLVSTKHQQASCELLIHFYHFCSFRRLSYPSESGGSAAHPEVWILWDFSLCFCKSNHTNLVNYYSNVLNPTIKLFPYLQTHFVLTLILYSHLCIFQWKQQICSINNETDMSVILMVISLCF